MLLCAALEEDLGVGDVTTLATIDSNVRAHAVLRVRQDGVIAGLSIWEPLLRAFRERNRPDEEAESLRLTDAVQDGTTVRAGDAACTIVGTARALLIIERTFLNFVGRLSGVATLTRKYVEAVRAVSAKTQVLDTRKTTPGWRALEKYAVSCGGGRNHRMGLYDAILIKDNHIEAAGSIEEAVHRAIAKAPKGIRVEVECDTMEQVERALSAGATALLLDNFSPAEVEAAVAQIAGRARVEVSGGVSLESIADYARSGVDEISVGRLTHSAPSLDVALEVELSE
jgi:nicotinate-nucleotide pyrophosphorylase (carboxylating)